jgi:anti-anti-sigma regulatory factor
MALVRVDGRGSFKVSTSLKEFGQVALQAGATTAVLDMGRCIGMDSTFMGVLAGWATRLRQRPGGRLALINLSPRTRSLVATLGLDQIVQAYEAGPLPDDLHAAAALSEGLAALEPREESRATTTETMIEAHENLVQLSPENLPRFKDVLIYLREDLNRKTGDHS